MSNVDLIEHNVWERMLDRAYAEIAKNKKLYKYYDSLSDEERSEAILAYLCKSGKIAHRDGIYDVIGEDAAH